MIQIPEQAKRQLSPELGVPLDEVREVPPLQVLTDDAGQRVRLDGVVRDRVGRVDDGSAGGTRPE